jgi:hypothetical protein
VVVVFRLAGLGWKYERKQLAVSEATQNREIQRSDDDDDGGGGEEREKENV